MKLLYFKYETEKNEKEINQIKANRLKVYTNEKDDDENGFVRNVFLI